MLLVSPVNLYARDLGLLDGLPLAQLRITTQNINVVDAVAALPIEDQQYVHDCLSRVMQRIADAVLTVPEAVPA